MTAKLMLKRRKTKCTLYLGVSKEDNNLMKAHAWVRSGNIIATGAKGKERFKVVSIFSDA